MTKLSKTRSLADAKVVVCAGAMLPEAQLQPDGMNGKEESWSFWLHEPVAPTKRMPSEPHGTLLYNSRKRQTSCSLSFVSMAYCSRGVSPCFVQSPSGRLQACRAILSERSIRRISRRAIRGGTQAACGRHRRWPGRRQHSRCLGPGTAGHKNRRCSILLVEGYRGAGRTSHYH